LQFYYQTGTTYGILINKFQIVFEFGEGIVFNGQFFSINKFNTL